jgi:hypothetical protein
MSPVAALRAPAVLGEDRRRALWRALGANDSEADELLAYATSPLHGAPPPAQRFPMPDAPCVAAWDRYAAAARKVGAEAVLRHVFVQLRFPIQAGMSADPAYRASTRLGIHPNEDAPGVALMHPDGVKIFLHATPAGRVPVILAASRADFEQLVQAVTRRNEPDAIPSSMGACMVTGYNNWERIADHRQAFAARHPEDTSGEAWAAAFQELVPRTDLYQDRFMLLSSGPYSAVPSEALELPETEWRALSVRLRLEHECTHYFTRQAFGTMRKSLLDELIADYMGMVEAFGRFQAHVFLRFLGLEDYPLYRDGGRLQNYRGTPPLSSRAFTILSFAATRAAAVLEEFDQHRGARRVGVVDKARMIAALLQVGLEGLASSAAHALLRAALADAKMRIRGPF